MPLRPTVLASLAFVLTPLAPLKATTILWDAEGVDSNWSTVENWAGNISPAGLEIRFDNTGAIGSAGTVTSIVSSSLTVQSLFFQNTGSNFHTLQINSGAVLTLDGTAAAASVFQLGTNTAAANTSVAITGAGELVIQGRAAGKDFLLLNTDTTGGSSTLTLDMTGLASFVADVDQFQVASGAGKANFNVTLADSTHITANAMIFGNNTTPNPTGVLKLGQTNTFNSNTIILGGARHGVSASFRSGLTGTPTFKVRGTGGTDTDLANLIIGVNASTYGATSGGSSVTTTVLDTTAGAVDFRLDKLVIGVGGSIASNALGIGNGTLIFDEGSIVANSIILGHVINANSATTGATGDRGSTPNGTLDMRGGTLNAATLTIGRNDDIGTDFMQAAIRGRALISGGIATITGDVTLGIHTAASASSGLAGATLTISGGTLSIGGNLTLGQDGGNNSAVVTLSGGTLDMNGGSIIGITTLSLQSGTLQNVGEISGGGGLVKTTGGTLILDGVNTYTGGTTVSAGTLQVGAGGSSGDLGSGTVTVQSGAVLAFNRDDREEITQNITGAGSLQQNGPGKTILSGSNNFTGATTVNAGILQITSASALQGTTNLSVLNGATFSYRPGSASTLTLAAISGTGLNLANGSILEVELGGTIALNSGATASTTGTIGLNLVGNPLQNPTTGNYTLLSSPGGGLNGGTYDFNVFNATNFSAVLNAVTANEVSVSITSVPGGLTSAYWLGGQVAGAGGVWAQSGATSSNWASDAGGTATGLVPGAGTDVFLSVTSGATQQGTMTLGAAMTIQSLTIQDSTAVTLLGDLNTLTIGGGSAITVDSGAGLATLESRLLLDAATPIVTVNNAAGLVLSGELAGNALTKAGTRTLTISGSTANTYTGDISVNEGTLILNQTGFNAVTGGLIIGDGTGTDTVRLLGVDQIGDTSDVALQSSGVLDLNDQSETIDALNGSGLVTNSGTGAATLTVGAGDDAAASFSGVIEDGSGSMSLSKIGSGVQVLSGASTYSGLTLVSAGTLRLGASDVLASALTVDGATAVFDLGTGHTDTVGLVTLRNGGTITGGAGSVLSSSTDFALEDGTLSATLGGSVGLTKTTAGTLDITAAQTYTGTTNIVEGTVTLGAGASLPATSLIVGDGANATLTAAAGSTFDIGSGSSSNLYVGVRVASTTLNASDSTLDLSALSSATVNVGKLFLGSNIGNGNGGLTRGTLLWATNNTITASNSIQLGSTKSNGNAGTSIMTFGSGLNTVITPRFVIGGEKSYATVSIGAGGTLVLGSDSATTDLRLGFNANIGTGSIARGTLDLTGGTFIARLSTFVLGDKNGGGTSGRGEGFFTSGTSSDNSVRAASIIVGDLSGGTATGARGTGVLTWNGGLLEADSVVLGRFGSGLGVAEGTLNLNGGVVKIGSDLTDGGGVNSTTALNLNGATLDMQGHAIGSAASPIDTLTFQSGSLRNVSEINGGAGLVKSGSGTLVLTGTNTHTGATSVTGGTLWVQSSTAMGGSTSVSVSGGATFDYSPGGGEVLNLTSLTLADGAHIGAEVKNGSIVVSSTASTAGTIAVNVFGIAGQTLTTGTYNIVTATGGLDGASYTLGNLYNATNFTVDSVGGNATSIFINLTAVSAIPTAYWKGGFSGAANEWAVTNGTSASNWTTDAAGTAGTGLVPGTTTDVIFSATGATNQSAMILGANMSIGSLTFNDSSAVALNDLANSLTLNNTAALTVNSGAGVVSLSTRLSFANTAAIVNVDGGSSGLELGGILTGVNGFTKTGTGVLRFTGASTNTLSGTITVGEGLLELARIAGVDAISGDLIIGDGTGTDTVRLINADQISDNSIVTLNTGGVLDLNGLNESLGALGGTGGVVTSGAAGSITLTVGAGGQSASFAGTIEDGSGTTSLIKTGSGTQTLAAAQTYTGLTTINDGTLALGASNVLAGDLLISGAGAIFDLGTGHTNTLALVTLQNGGTINGGAGSLLSSGADFDFQSGTVNASLGGTTGIQKTTSGTVTLNSTASTFTGNVVITGGTLAIGANDALPTGSVVILGAGSQTGTLDLTSASQTLDSLLVQSSTSAVNNVVIGAGQTLTLNGGGLQLGIASSTGIDARATFSGGGALVISTPTQNLQVGYFTTPLGATPANNSDLNLAGLASFTADVNQFRAGYGSNIASDVILSDTANYITANTIEVGNSAGSNGNTGTLRLGAGINVIQANTLNVGLSKVLGVMDFASSSPGSPGTLLLTGRNGGEIDITVGSTAGTGTGATPHGTLDLRGHESQIRADAVIIGRRDGSLTGGAQGEIYFDNGSFTANSISMAAKSNVGAGTATALLQINGGNVVVGTGGFSLGSQVSAGFSQGTLVINGGTLVSGSSILEGGGATTTTLTLNGGTLDLQGNTIGDATNSIDNLNFQSGVLRNVNEINNGAGLVKTSAGTLLLSGTNTFTGGVTVNAGTLRVTESTALAASNTVNVASGAAFHFSDGAGGTLNIENLTLAGGSSIGAEVGGGGIVVNPGSTVAASGTINVDIYGIAGFPYSSGTYDLVTAVGGGLDSAAYAIGNYYNITSFTLNSVGVDADSVFVNITSATELAAAYWKGGYSGATNVWAVSNGTTTSNWTTDSDGLIATPQVPGSTTDVFFSATGATDQAVTVLGANMSIGSLTITDSTASMLVDSPGSTLTINKAAAISIGSTAGTVTLNTRVALAGTAPVIDVANSGGLTINGLVSGNALTKTGAGTLTLSGATANTMAGTVTVNEGSLVLQKADDVAAIAGDLVIGDSSGTDTVVLTGSGQLSVNTLVTVNTGAVLDLSGGTESFKMLQGTGTVTNTAPTLATMTLGSTDAGGTFDGVIQDGTGVVGLVKKGTGTISLSGASANTFTGDTLVSRGTLALAKADNVQALGSANIRIASAANTGSANSVLRLDANEQLRSDVAITTYAEGGRNAQFNLNGYTQTIGSLDLETTTNGGTTVATGAGGTLIVNGDIILRNNRNATGDSPRHVLITGSGSVSTAAKNSGTLDLGGGTRTITALHVYAQPDADALIETVVTNGGIIKEGNSVLYLSADNNYTGITTVNNGALLVTGSHTGGGNYTVATGATLGGNGQINLATNASVDVNGTIDVGSTLGASTAGRLDFTAAGSGAVNFHDGSALTLALISGAGSGDQSGITGAADIFKVTGDLTIGSGVSLNVVNPNSMTGWTIGDRWRLLDWSNIGTLSGTFDLVLPDLTSVGLAWDSSDLYAGGTLAVVVPEPGRMLLLGLGGLILLLRRRRTNPRTCI